MCKSLAICFQGLADVTNLLLLQARTGLDEQIQLIDQTESAGARGEHLDQWSCRSSMLSPRSWRYTVGPSSRLARLHRAAEKASAR
jgi:hypothetical protein